MRPPQSICRFIWANDADLYLSRRFLILIISILALIVSVLAWSGQ